MKIGNTLIQAIKHHKKCRESTSKDCHCDGKTSVHRPNICLRFHELKLQLRTFWQYG